MLGMRELFVDARALIADEGWVDHREAECEDGELAAADSPNAVAFSGTEAVIHQRAPKKIEDAAMALLNEAAAAFIVPRGSVVIKADQALDEVNDSDTGFYGLPDPHACVLRAFDMAISWAAE